LLDITNIENIKTILEKEQVNVIINCAAYTNVDAAEDE
jgi:dTDP-4-dehydrorhamnose reductase